MTLVVLVAALLFSGSCSDDGITYPTGEGGWQVAIGLGQIPPWNDNEPVVVTVQAEAIDLTDGDRPADGSLLVFCASDGSFANGSAEIELGTVNGRATAELEIARPATYQIEVSYPDRSCSALVEFSYGLE
jgi:hypothetical protein